MAKRTAKKSAQEELESAMNPATDKEPKPRKRVATKKKVTKKEKATTKTGKSPEKKTPAKGKGKGKTVKKETEAQKQRREEKERDENYWEKVNLTQEQLHKKHVGGAKEKFSGTPSPDDFKWRPRKKKGVWDGSPGVYISPDPCQKYKDYPSDYMTDPVTKLAEPVRIKFLKKTVDGMQPEEVLVRVDRRLYMRKTQEALLKLDLEVPAQRKKYNKVMDVLSELVPVEYFAVAGEPRIICAVSFGEDGKSPVDKE